MKGALLGNYHTYDDLNLIINSKEIGDAAVREKKLEVEGASGYLDYTDFFGEPTYDNRTLLLNVQMLTEPSKFLSEYSNISNALNGQKVRIILDDDPDFYYIGRISISALITEKNQAFFEIVADCEPFKLKKEVTTVSQAVTTSATITLNNLRKRVVPVITSDAEFQFVWGKFSAKVSAGTFQLPEFELVAGSNTITVIGTGNVVFEYQEGGL